MGVPGQKPSRQQLEALRLEYARNGRNIRRLSETSSVCETSLRTYRKEYQWDTWADKLNARTDEKALERGSDVNADALEAASIGIRKIKEAIDSARMHGSKIGELSMALEKLHKVVALLTGGDTERIDFSRYSDGELADELKRLEEGLRDSHDS